MLTFTGNVTAASGLNVPVSVGDVAETGSYVEYCQGTGPFALFVVRSSGNVLLLGNGTVTAAAGSLQVYDGGDEWTVTFSLPVTGPTDPTTKDDCKKDGWLTYGFRNQGQCVRFVETGKGSRG
ncbi:MAG: hypothetical protein AABZ29_04735 [Gemmatimonadota bacterium]